MVKITLREGFSGVDHLASEAIWYAEKEANESNCTTLRAVKAAIRRTLKTKFVNPSRTYASYGITAGSYSIEIS